MPRTLAIGLLAALLPFAVATAEPLPVPADWHTTVADDHPLVGTLWHVAEGRQASPDALARAGAAADFVLLGEKHDNPDHHHLQAWMIRALVAAGRRPAVAFEMLNADQDDALHRYLENHPGEAAGLGEAVGWDERGWPEWAIYRPVADAAVAAGLPLRSADVDRATQRQVAQEGFAALADGRRAELTLDQPLAAPLREDLRQELVASHCDMLPEEAIAPMAKVQRLRDATMAGNLIAAREGAGQAVLIAGNGHVRADRGVPWYLRARLKNPTILTLAIVEVRPGEEGWRAALPERHTEAPLPYDFIWFTPRVDNDDPCEKFAEQLRKHGESGKAAD